MMCNLPIYLISLDGDFERRKQLMDKFPKKYENFIHIKAVDGRKITARNYFLEIQKYFVDNKRIISPNELGCTLSHIEALKAFLESGCERALILEDDIIGNDEDIEIIKSIAFNIPEDSFFICGSQDSINKNVKYLIGKYITNQQVYEIAKFSYSHIFGTYCYVVTRSSANAILNYQKKGKTLADKWDVFFKNTAIKILYKDIMLHPLDINASHIEKERVLKNIRNFNRFYLFDLFFRFLNKLKNIVFKFFYILLPGWKRIH